MGKIVALIVIVALVYFLILPKFTRSKNDIKRSNYESKGKVTDLVECSKCKTLVDMKEATISTSGYVCDECLKGK